MSTAIDKRIVEMVFNNKDFMKNMTSTSKALESFDGQIEELGQTTAFDKVAKATEPMGVAIEAVGAKAVVLQELISKVTGKIVDGIFDMVGKVQGKINELTFDQIGAGFNKYEEKIKSVQTIMNATGESIDVVNSQLDKLMWYADETSYSFTDMTNNVGKFTSVGISLDDSVTAMMGIANWAALSGAGINEASRAMYNFSQAMGAGVMMTKDWVSIENANMATKEFKETVIETAKELKAAGKLGDDYDFDLEGLTFEGFRDSLSEGWFTKPIMEEALKKYGNYTEELYKIKQEFEEAGEYKTVDELKEIYDQRFRESEELYNSVKEAYAKYGKESKEFRDVVNQNGVTMQTALDLIQEKQNEEFNKKLEVDAENLKKTAEEFGKDSEQFKKAAQDAGYSIEDASEMIEKGVVRFQKAVKSVSERGFAAGQEAKTFTDAWEAAKDAVSSQWATLYEQIFGNYEEAKIMWTTLANTMWDVFAGPIEQLNGIIGLWVELGGREKLFDVESGAIANIWNAISGIFENIKTALVAVFPIFDSYENFSYILYDLTERFHAFSENLALDGYQSRILTTVFKGLFSILKFVGNTIKTIGESLGMIFKAILPETIDWNNILKFIRDMIQNLDSTSEKFYVNTMMFTGKVISKIHQLKNFLDSLNLQERIVELKNKATEFAVTVMNKITVLGSVFQTVVGAIRQFKDGLNNTQTLGELANQKIGELKDTIDEKLQPVLEKMQPLIEWYNQMIDKVMSVIDKVKEAIKRLPSILLNVAKTIVTVIRNLIRRIITMRPEQLVEFLNSTIFTSILLGIKNYIKNFNKFTDQISNSVGTVVKLKENISNTFKGIGKSIDDLTKKIGDSKKLEAYAELLRSFAISMLIFAGAMLLISSIPADQVSNTLTLLAAAFSELIIAYYVITQTASDVIQAAAMKEATNAILKLGVAILLVAWAMSGFTKLDDTGMRNGVIGLGAVVAAMIAFYGAMSIIISNEEDADKIDKKIIKIAKAMIKMSIAIAILSVAVRMMGTLNIDQLGKGLAGVGVLLVWMYAFMAGMDKMLGPTTSGEGLFTETSGGGLDVKKLLAIGVAMNLIAGALIALMIPVELMAHMSLEQLGKGLGGVLVLIIEMAALFEFLSAKVGTDMGAGKILAIAFAMDLMAAAFTTLMIPVELMGHMGLDQLAKGLIGMLVLVIEIGALFEYLSVKMETMGAGKILAIAVAMDLIAAALIALTIPVIAMGKILDGGQLIKGLVGVGILLLEIGIFTALIDKTEASALKLVGIGLAMFVLSAAISAIAKNVKLLGTMDAVSLFRGVAAIGAIMAMMFVFTKLLSLITAVELLKLGAVSLCFVVLSTGIGILAASIKSFDGIKIGTIITSLLTVAAVLAIFAGLAALLTPVLLPMLGLALILPLVGAGLLLFSMGISALESVLAAGNPFIKLGELINQTLDDLTEWLDKYGQDFIENHLLPFLKAAVIAFGELLWTVIGPVYEFIVDWLSDLFLKVEHKVKEKLEEFKQNWKDGWHALTDPVKNWITQFGEDWDLWWDAFVYAATNPFKEFAKGWSDFWKGIGEKVYDAVSYIEEDVVNRFKGAIDKLTDFFAPFFDKISEWIQNIKDLKEGLSEDWNGFWDNWKSGVDDMGYWLFGDPADARDAGKATADAAVEGVQEGLDIHSPSKRMENEVGKQAGAGLVKGEVEAVSSEEAKKTVSNAAAETGKEATNSFVDNLMNSDDVKSKVARKIADALGIDVNSLVQKYGSVDNLLGAFGVDVNSNDLANLDVNKLLKNNGIDTSNLSIDTSNINLNASGVTLDTSNINLDTNGQNVDLGSVGYDFDESQIHTLGEYQGEILADGMAKGYDKNSDKVTSAIDKSVQNANGTNKKSSTSTSTTPTIFAVKRFVDGQEILAQNILELVKPVKQNTDAIKKAGKGMEEIKWDIIEDPENSHYQWRHRSDSDIWIHTDKNGKWLKDFEGNVETQKYFAPDSAEGKANKELWDKQRQDAANEAAFEKALGKFVKGKDAKGDEYYGRQVDLHRVILTDQNGHVLKTDDGRITIYDPVNKVWTETTFENESKRDAALREAAKALENSKTAQNAMTTTKAKAITDVDTEAAKKKAGTTTTTTTTGSTSKTTTTAQNATQTAANATDYLRSINEKAGYIYDQMVAMASQVSTANNYLVNIEANTHASATNPVPASIDKAEIDKIAKRVNTVLGFKAALTGRGV